LPAPLKAQRGTLRPSRERQRAAPGRAVGTAHSVIHGFTDSVNVRDTPATEPTQTAQDAVGRDFEAIAVSYVADVLSGRVVACGWVRKACERFERMREAAKTTHASYFWSPSHVQDVCAFIEQLPHVEGKWTTDTITLQPWQVWILAACYGFRRPDGSRLVTTVFFEVGRKSAKSTLVAAAALYHLAVEREPGAQVVCGASTGNQARIVFGILQRMVKRSQWLRELGFESWANAVTFEDGSAKPINAKSSTQDGLNPSFISLDESHAQSFELHDVLKSAQGARSEAALWAPTTAGYSMTSVGFALRSSAMKILDHVIESDHTFCVLYELDEADDWRDETVWPKALPMIGVTPTLDYVRRYRDDAIATPGLQGEFETKMGNRWLHSASSWLSVPAWNACADPALRLDDFAHQRCWVGVDLAERDDIAAVAFVFERDGQIVVFVKGYLPEMVIAERARAVPEYRAWLKSGELIPTAGNMTDYGVIETDIREACATFDVADIVIERYGALHLASNLAGSGLPARIESKNTKVFTAPAKELEARIRAGKIRHDGNSFLTWQISNVCCERRRDGSLLPTKESAESPHKIDAVDAILLGMSASLVATAPQEYRIVSI
jgi:phage terminase large subunit-like protein